MLRRGSNRHELERLAISAPAHVPLQGRRRCSNGLVEQIEPSWRPRQRQDWAWQAGRQSVAVASSKWQARRGKRDGIGSCLPHNHRLGPTSNHKKSKISSCRWPIPPFPIHSHLPACPDSPSPSTRTRRLANHKTSAPTLSGPTSSNSHIVDFQSPAFLTTRYVFLPASKSPLQAPSSLPHQSMPCFLEPQLLLN